MFTTAVPLLSRLRQERVGYDGAETLGRDPCSTLAKGCVRQSSLLIDAIPLPLTYCRRVASVSDDDSEIVAQLQRDLSGSEVRVGFEMLRATGHVKMLGDAFAHGHATLPRSVIEQQMPQLGARWKSQSPLR